LFTCFFFLEIYIINFILFTRLYLLSYKTTACLRFPPHTLAVASIYLAVKLLQLNDFPPSTATSDNDTREYEWYELFLCRIEDIEGNDRINE